MFTKGEFVSTLLPCITHKGITNSCISTNYNVTMRHVSCFHLLCTERATSSSLPSEDWELNMEICDIINSSEEGCVNIRYLLASGTSLSS